MQVGRSALAVAICALVALGACASKNPNLMQIHSTSNGPDEFGIMPVKPLEMPENLASLPQPTPGGSNLVDPNPEADAIAALGGNPKAAEVTRSGIPSGDVGLVNYASRYGITPDIRQVTASEDLAYRQKHQGRPLERLFGTNVYYKAYKPMELDQYRELARWRSAGVRTVSAPPPQKGESSFE